MGIPGTDTNICLDLDEHFRKKIERIKNDPANKKFSAEWNKRIRLDRDALENGPTIQEEF